MRLGFIDCAANEVDAFDAFSKIAEEKVAGAHIDRITAPDLLKLPLCAKKILRGGSELAIAFLTLSEDDLDPMALVHEKLIDVEVAEEKFILFCIVSTEEYGGDPARLEQLIEARFSTVLELASRLQLSPAQVSGLIGDKEMAAELSALAGFASGEAKEDVPAGGDDAGQQDTGGSTSLF